MWSYDLIVEDMKRKKRGERGISDYDRIVAEKAFGKIQDLHGSLIEGTGSYVNDYNSRYFDEEGNYVQKYRTDHNDWSSSMSTRRDSLYSTQSQIESLLDKYGMFYNQKDVGNIYKSMNDVYNSINDIGSNISKEDEFYKTYATEADYKQDLEAQKEYEELLNLDTNRRQADIEDYHKNNVELKKQIESYNTEAESIANELVKLNTQIKDLQNEINENAYVATFNDTERAKQDERKKRLKNWQAIYDEYAGNGYTAKASELQKQYDEGLSAINAKYDKAVKIQETNKLEAVGDINSPEYDEDFENYRNYGERLGEEEVEGKGAYARKNKVAYLRNNPDALEIYETSAKAGNSAGKHIALDKVIYKAAKYMTDEQFDVYNYYIGKGDEDTAMRYLESFEEELNYKQGIDLASQQDNAFERIVFGYEAGLDQVYSNFESIFNGDSSMPTSGMQYASSMVREDMGSGFGQVVYDIANTTGNMAPSLGAGFLANTFLPGSGAYVTNAIMGLSAGGGAYQSALANGYTNEQARTYGVLVGSSEALLGKLIGSIGNAGSSLTGKAITNMVDGIDNAFLRGSLKVLGNMASEGLEESMQEVLEPFIQNIALNTNNTWSDIKWADVAYSGLLGALSAGLLESVQTYSNEYRVQNAGQAVKDAGQVSNLVKFGKSLSPDSVAYELAGKVDETTGAYTIGKLLHEAGADSLTQTNLADITTALESKGVAPVHANVLAKWFNKAVGGETFTDAQKAAMDYNEVLGEVIYDTIVNQNSTVNQRLQGYKDIVAKTSFNQAVEKTRKQLAKAEQKAAKNAQNSTESVNPDAVEGTDATEEETALGSKFEVNAEGKTINNATGDIINVQEVASIKDGEMTLKLDNGDTVNAKDVSFATQDEGLLYSAVLDMGVNAEVANQIVKKFDPQGKLPVNRYILGMQEAYKYGKYNIPVREMSGKAFSADLSVDQRAHAYQLGQSDARAESEAAQKVINEAVKNSGKKDGKKGEVHFDGDELALTERQSVSKKALEKIADALGVDFHLYKSYLNDDGKRVFINRDGVEERAPHGMYYRDGSIYIDINAGYADSIDPTKTQQTILFTAAHELVHYIKQWSPAKFKVLADFLMEQYGKKGVSVNYLVEEQIKKAKQNRNYKMTYDEAFEEVIADSMESMLADGKVAEKLALLKEQDKSLWKKIKQFFSELAKSISKVYAGLKPNSKEGRYVAEMKDAIDRIQELFAEGLVDASENYQAAGGVSEGGNVRYSFSSISNTFFGNESMTLDEFTSQDYKNTEGYQNYVNECLNNFRQTRGENFDEAAAMKEIEESIDGIVRVAVAMKKAGYDIFDDGTKRSVKDSKKRFLFSSLEPNSDYFTSSDISTICDKRKNFADIYDDIVRAEEKMGVPKGKRFFDNIDNYFYLHGILAEKGLTQPCRQCYVESMRKNLAPMANAFLRLVNETNVGNKANDQLYQPKGKNKGQLKTNNAELRVRVLEVLAEYGMSPSDLTVEMLTTEDGLAELKISAPLVYEAFNSFYWQSKPKMPKAATPFRFGELTALLVDHKGKIKKSLVEKINSTGGFRLQSYSDFQIQNFVDVLQVIFEAGTLGFSGHAYTKVPAFLDATEGTNLKRNISIFMYKDGDNWVLDRNDSFPYSLDEIYDIVNADKSGNTGIIAVSQNEDMSCWIMANDFVAYGIPFHKSGLKMGTVRDTDVKTEDGRIVKGYSGTKDHTRSQTEVWAKANADHKALTKVKKGINIYAFWDFDNVDGLSKEELIRKNVTAYIDACEDAGYLPKFREYVMNNEKVLKRVLSYAKELGFVPTDATIEDIAFEYKGYTIPYGYYKFLGDFSMFTPDGKASPHDTLSLADYDFDKAVEFFEDAETLRRNEILQQFANDGERQKYAESGMTAGELQEVVRDKRASVVSDVMSRYDKGVKHSDRDYSYNALVGKPDMPITIVGNNTYTNRADVLVEARKNAAKVGKTNEDGSVSVYVDDIGVNILLGSDGLKHGLRRTKDAKNEPNYIVTVKAGEIIKNSIKVNEMNPQKANAIRSYALIGVAKNTSGDLYIVRSVINQFNQLAEMDVLYAINAKKESAALNAPRSTAKPLSDTDSSISIADLLDYVNKYFPDILPADVLKHYNYTERPDGDFSEDVLYSDRDIEQEKAYQKVTQQLSNENAKLREDLTYLKELLKLQGKVTNGKMLSKTSLQAVAKRLMSYSRAKGDVSELVNHLNDVYSYILSGEDVSWEGVSEKAAGAIDWLIDHEQKVAKRDEYSDMILKEMRTKRVSLNDGQKAEAIAAYGSLREFRNKVMGSVIIATDGVPLDSVWNDLSRSYPAYFDPEMSDANQAVGLVEAIESLRSTEVEDGYYEYEQEMVAQDLLTKVYDAYWDVATLHTVADAKQKQINLLKSKHKQQMDALRQSHKDKDAALRKAYREKMQKLRETYRESAEAKLKKKAEQYQESRHKAVENRQKTALKQSIKRVVNRLNSLLNKGNKERNVKIGLRDTVASALDAAEILFNTNITNDDIVRNGIDFATEEDVARLDDYRALLNSRDTLIAKIESITQNEKPADSFAKVEALYADIDKIDARISKLGKELSNVFAMERARISKATVSSAIDKVAEAYESIKTSEDEYIKNAYDEYVAKRLGALKESIGGTLIRDMSADQLRELFDAFTMIAHTVSNANKMFRDGKAEDLAKRVTSVQMQIMSHYKKLKNDPRSGIKSVTDFLKGFAWNEMKPLTAFETLGSDAFTELFWDAIKAEGDWAKFMEEAEGFLDKQRKAYGYKSWNMEKAHEFKLPDGKVFKLTLQDMMSIYAYSKREQAYDHMTKGGFQFTEHSEYKDDKGVKRIQLTGDLYATDLATINQIVSALNKIDGGKVVKYVDAVQGYLTDLGKKGNEVSRVLYGIDIFNEAVYFPLMSAKDYRSSVETALNNTQTQVSLKNTGMTKQTVPKAKNPIILQGFDEVAINHIKKMADYTTQVLPIENLRRVFDSVSLADEGSSVATKAIISKVFGTSAEKYFDQYITDLNGGTMVDGAKSPFSALFSKFKATAVGASLSVVVQQPFAIFRAMEEIAPRHFIVGKAGKSETKHLYDEIRKYAPVAIIKAMGGFDTGSNRTAQDYLGVRTDKGAKRVVDEISDKSTWLAGKADELGWNAIWLAVKREVNASNKYKFGSKDYYDACGQRFTEVIVRTQVYDSVNSRSGWMRSKSEAVKFATSFMGEPTTIINQAYLAILKLTRAETKADKAKARKNLGRTMGVLTASTVLTTAAKSLIYAMRDDEDDESLGDRWAYDFGNSLKGDIHPLNLIPYGRDLVSLFDGWDVERPDITLIANAIKSYQKLLKDDATPEECMAVFGDTANLFGIPAKNLIRDTKGIYHFFRDITDDVTADDMGGAFKAGWKGIDYTDKVKAENAFAKGDTRGVSRIVDGLVDDKVKAGKTEKEAKSAVRSSFTSTYKKQYLEAYEKRDRDEMNRIRKLLYATGLYGKLSELDEDLEKWRKDE